MSLYCRTLKSKPRVIRPPVPVFELSALWSHPITHHQRFFHTVFTRIRVSCEGKTAIGVASPMAVPPRSWSNEQGDTLLMAHTGGPQVPVARCGNQTEA